MHDLLPLLMLVILALVIFIYVVLDGFDLGVGINFLLIHDEENRDIMMNSIAPIWDGNETWMVLGAAILYSAFPMAFSVLLPYFYLEICVMLVGLIFRGISFEFRFKDELHKPMWSMLFALSSLIIAFIQGLILGQMLEGLAAPKSELTLLPVIAGFGVCVGYALLGSTWLIRKTASSLQDRCYKLAREQTLILMGFFAAVSLLSPLLNDHIYSRWFSYPDIYFLLPLPLLSIIGFFYLVKALLKKQEKTPFMLVIGLFFLAYMGQIHNFYPYAVPFKLTVWQASSDVKTQIFVLVGLVILLPVLVGYTWYTYRVFQGKASSEHLY